jgi:putative transcriptional regulator
MKSFAGKFLVARPVLQDPSFRHSVVLLLQHNAEGALGLVVNRPLPTPELPFPVYRGGPCGKDQLRLLHGHAEWESAPPDEADPPVLPGVFLGDAGCLERVTNPSPEHPLRFRVFTGYAGWGPEQLEGELSAGAWAIVPASAPLLFDTPPQELWDILLPPSLPQPSLN